MPSAIQPVVHCDEILVPVFTGLTEINTDEGEPTDVFLTSDNFDTLSLFTQAE